ncbi:NfeD family protein [Merdimmobilis hominis]|jgi:membrane protein implicated in regulation of membrane protease activity|uniref:NfeD-like C-terminal domain-containing protein n=1 Tax=uncultured Anaerotruncus sp. TaxID=905011 RepID=A0A6N2SNL8_9FIRM|nr:NfeD family protein [Merdimmobilis hominis]MCD4836157.1 NfeD family protein [Merdimmobilis hominis]PWL63285.1 MAG: NfeD family protein [Oscillospiraceae bacterium]
MDALQWMPFVWLLMAVLLGILEAATIQLVAIWFAIGSVAAVPAALMGLSFFWQVVVFLAVSLFCLVLTRPLMKKFLRVRPTRTNADSLVGMIGVVVEEIDNDRAQGRVYVNGLDWSARSEEGEILEKGEKVLIKAIEGVKVLVERI